MAEGFQVMNFKPGVSREATKLTNTGTWWECDKVRFRSGYPQKIGGWYTYAYGTLLGQCRDIWEWITLEQQNLFGAGTNCKYYVYYGGTYWDITPLRAIQGPLVNNPFFSMYDTLAAGITDRDTIIPVTNVVAANMALIAPFTVNLIDPVSNNEESIYVPAVDTVNNTLGAPGSPCIRGAFGTTANSYAAGTPVASRQLVLSIPVSQADSFDFMDIVGATAFGPYTAAQLNSNVMAQNATNAYLLLDYGILSTAAQSGGGNNVTVEFLIHSMLPYPSVGAGWGAGYWGGVNPPRAWGTPATSGIVSNQMGWWTSANFGEDLILNPRFGSIYYWQISTSFSASGQATQRAININALPGADGFAPNKCTFIGVSDERHIIAFGCNDTVDGTGIPNQTTPLDPLFISWCDQSNPTIWEPLISNVAGNYRLTYGSKIMAVCPTRQEILVWTDTALYSMRYLGAPFVYGFTALNTNITIVSPNCYATANGVTYWMGHDKFYLYNGNVNTLPCTLRQYIFDDINQNQWEQICCGTNEEYNEVWWMYCSQDSDIINRYVIYNTVENLWYYGKWSRDEFQGARTYWYDAHMIGSPVAAVDISADVIFTNTPHAYKANQNPPISAGTYDLQIAPIGVPYQQLVQHEIGNDNGEVSPPIALSASISTGWFDIGEGGYRFAFLSRIIPDIEFLGSTTTTPSATMSLAFTDFPGQSTGTPTMQNADAPTIGRRLTTQVYDYTHQVWVRARGRLMSFSVTSNDMGVAFQVGSPRAQIRADGRR